VRPLGWLADRIAEEPVQAQAVIQSAIALGCAFGLHMTPIQIGATLAFTSQVLAFLTRRAVTPNASLRAPADPLT
jgi:hypothetical protein